MSYTNNIVYRLIGYVFKQGALGKLPATSNTNKVFFRLGIQVNEIDGETQKPTGKKTFEQYQLFQEDGDKYTLTTTKQKFKITIEKDNFDTLQEWEHKVLDNFISQLLDVS